MARSEDGWWSGPPLTHGDDYAFVVDGRGPYPDPRSPWQPHGVHGNSRAFDAGRFEWTDGDWRGRDVRGAVSYELHVGTFTPHGTLDSAATVMAELAEIGIELVELMPLAPIPGTRGWGYDGVSLYAVYEQYGGPEALQRFVDAAHAVGIAVALDVVYNHLGPDGNYLGEFGPYFTEAHHTPWGAAVNFDHEGGTTVRRYVIDNALRWFRDFHIDALRLDAVHELYDDSPQHVLAQLSCETAALAAELGRPLSLVAESDANDSRLVADVADGGLGQTAQWADDVHHSLHAYLMGETKGLYSDFGPVETVDKAFRRVFVHDGGFSTFRNKNWGNPVPDHVDRRKFVVFASNHDQVGNRATGDRPSESLTPGALATSLALILLSPFTPMLFQGEEYGETRPFLYFCDHDEPLGSSVTAGRIAEFAGHGWIEGAIPPDPQDPSTFAASKLDRTAAMPANTAIREWVRNLMDARQRTLVPGAWIRHPAGVEEADPRQLTMTGPVRVHANLSAEPVTYQARPLAVFGNVAVADEGFTLMPDAVALVAQEA